MDKFPFVVNENLLQDGLFRKYTARTGAQTFININFIPDFLQYLKTKMTSEELIRLEDYHLQNYLMELSVSYKDSSNLMELTSKVLTHIRSNNNFWYRHNNQELIEEEMQQKHHAIDRYHKDIQHLRQVFETQDEIKPFQPIYPRRTPLTHTFYLLHRNSQPHFGTRQPLNYLAFIPDFVLTKQRQYNQAKSQQAGLKSQSNQIVEKQQKQLQKNENSQVLSLMQECIIYLLSNKADNIPTKLKIDTPQQSSQNQQLQQMQSPSSKSQIIQSQNKTILDLFQLYMQNYTNLPKYPNSHHIHMLTHNLIVICESVLNNFKKHHEFNEDKTVSIVSSASTQDSIKVMGLPQDIKQILSNISERQLGEIEIQQIASTFVLKWNKQLKAIAQQIRTKQHQTIKIDKGWLCSTISIEKVKDQYQQMLDQPQFIQLTKYRALGTGVPWKEQDYLKFLKGLNQYLNIPTNNKRIATYMGDGFEPNHVKHVKGVYLLVMKERLDRGQRGGGQRGKCLSKSDFIEKDIGNFSMRWFQKAKKLRKRKPKRKRRNTSSQEIDEDVDSEY